MTDEALAGRFGIPVPEVAARLADARALLLARRAERPQPARDDKALAAWNGLAIAAFADAAVALAASDPDAAARYRSAAERAVGAIVGGLVAPDGSLGRSWKDGRAVGRGVLEDYADLSDGLLALYEATFDERWFEIARALMDRVLGHFADPAGGFFDTADDHERLVTRPKDVQDNAVPSGNAMAARVLLRLAAWTGVGTYRDAAEAAMRTVVPYVVRYATGFAQWLSAMDLAVAPAIEVAIVGAPDGRGDGRSVGRGAARLPAEPGRVRGGRGRRERGPAADRSGRARWSADRVRLSRLRLPPAGHRDHGARRAARGSVTERELEAHPAATVVLLRSGTQGLEALLTHRPPSMAFAGGAHVFPGGRVDAADSDPGLAARSAVSGEDAARALGGDLAPETALAAYLAALRELFEEAGVLLADTDAPAARVAEARTALLAGDATLASVADALDLRLRTDLLVPLSRWVTPRGYPRRFDARFFAAALPDGAIPSFEGGEVVAHVWLRPGDALEAMAGGAMTLWLPTSTTLQQLEHVQSIDEIRTRLAPGRLGAVLEEEIAPGVTRILMPAGGGVAGQPVCAYLVGRRRFVLVDPGDPTGPGLDLALALAAARGGGIGAVALTHVDADHAAGAEGLAENLGIEVLTGPGGGRPLPYPVRELADLEVLDTGDIPLRVIHTPGPRPDHLAFLGVGDDGDTFVLTGDLDGVRGARSVVGPPDPSAWTASVERVAGFAPGARRLSGHPSSEDPA